MPHLTTSIHLATELNCSQFLTVSSDLYKYLARQVVCDRSFTEFLQRVAAPGDHFSIIRGQALAKELRPYLGF